MAKKKKKKDFLSTSFFSGPVNFAPTHSSLSEISKMTYHMYIKQPFEVDPYRLRQLFNIPAYIAYATILPTPLEQIAFAKDPLRIVPPYEWRGSFHAVLDLAATVADPIGVARSKIVNPYPTIPHDNLDWLIDRQLAAGYVEGDYYGHPTG